MTIQTATIAGTVEETGAPIYRCPNCGREDDAEGCDVMFADPGCLFCNGCGYQFAVPGEDE